MARMAPAERIKRGKELKPIREAAFKIWKENPKMTGAELRNRLGDLAKDIAPNTPETWVNRWRKGEGLARTMKVVEPVKEKPETVQPLTVANVADALLERVVEAVTNYDAILNEVKELRPLKGQVTQLEVELKKISGEKDRLLKIHNDQAKRGVLTDTKTLMKLARIAP